MRYRDIKFDAIVIHYGEIILKRSKRGRFERILQENIRTMTGLPVKRLQGRFVIELEEGASLESLLERIGKIFGVVWYAPAIKAGSLEELQERLLEAVSMLKPRSLKIDTRRSDKSFPITSIEVSRRIGKYLASESGVRIDLKNPESRIFIEITEDGIYASFEKLKGPGGLPLGSSGRVLGLFSGGAYSALACWFMMKRGCRVDLLHLCPARGDVLLESDFRRCLDKILEYSPTLKLFLASDQPFMRYADKVPSDVLSLLFGEFMLRVGEEVAEHYNYPGIVLGSRAGSSGDVEDLSILLVDRRLPVYTPLIAFSEDELRRRIRELGFEPLESLHIHPLNRLGKNYPRAIDLRDLEKFWRELNLDRAVEESLRGLEVFRITSSGYRKLR